MTWLLPSLWPLSMQVAAWSPPPPASLPPSPALQAWSLRLLVALTCLPSTSDSMLPPRLFPACCTQMGFLCGLGLML